MNKIIEVNCETGETEEREMTSEEQVIHDAVIVEEDTEALINSARAKLLALGLTEEEVLAIMGRA